MGQGLSGSEFRGSPLAGPGSPPSPCCPAAARAQPGRGRWCEAYGERCGSRSGTSRGWERGAVLETRLEPHGGARLPGKGPLLTSRVQSSGCLPGRWGALTGALRGSPPLSGGFLLFQEAHSSAQWTSTLRSSARANSPGRDPVPLSMPGHGPAQGSLSPGTAQHLANLPEVSRCPLGHSCPLAQQGHVSRAAACPVTTEPRPRREGDPEPSKGCIFSLF